MSISDYAENKILDAVLNHTTTGGGLPTADVYVQLHTVADPGEAGTTGVAGNTTRKLISFGPAAAGVATSDADVTWTGVSTTETYAGVSLWDAAAAGNCLWSGPLTATKAVNAGDTFTLPSGQVTVSLD